MAFSAPISNFKTSQILINEIPKFRTFQNLKQPAGTQSK